MKTIKMISLSRLAITGSLGENTPACVLREIVEAHGLSLSDSVESTRNLIERSSSLTLNQEMTLDDYKKLARFINKNVRWTTDSLHVAYQFLCQFSDPSFDESSLLKSSWTAGSQTPENPRSLNLTVLYSICLKNNLKTTVEMSAEQLERAVRLLAYPQTQLEDYLRSELLAGTLPRPLLIEFLAKISNEPISSLVNVTTELVDEVIEPVVTRRHLLDILPPLSNINSLRNLVTPVSKAGAVALAALNYAVDLSLARDPVAEYKHLKETSPYIPHDLYLNKWYCLNKRLFSLQHYFNPLFSDYYYRESDLQNLALQEGYSKQQIREENCYSLLTAAYRCQTFYEGVVPPLKEKKTLIGHEELDEITDENLYSYGTRNQPMVLFTDSELIQLFDVNSSFLDVTSTGGSLFSEIAINKLVLIGSPSLQEVITRIRAYQLLDPPTKAFVQMYRSLTHDNQLLIDRYLTLVLELAMFMRGWSRGMTYPISSSEIVKVKIEEGQIFLNVTEAYQELDEHLKELRKILVSEKTLEYHLLSLPLVRQVEGKYLQSKNIEDGLTIGDRLRISKQESSNDSSCIRLTSNWLAASAHKYLVNLGKEAPFELQKLRVIS